MCKENVNSTTPKILFDRDEAAIIEDTCTIQYNFLAAESALTNRKLSSIAGRLPQSSRR